MAEKFTDKMSVSNQMNFSNIEIDNFVEGYDLTDTSGKFIENMRRQLISNNKNIVLINSSHSIEDYEYYRVLFRKALAVNAWAIKITIPDAGEELEGMIRPLAMLAQNYDIRLLAENNAESYLANDQSITKIYKNIGSEFFRFIFNPLEFVRTKRHPFFNVFYGSRMKNSIDFLRINDGLFVDGSPILPGEGNAEIKEMASILISRGFKGYFSFTPYAGQLDMDVYMKIIDNFKNMLFNL